MQHRVRPTGMRCARASQRVDAQGERVHALPVQRRSAPRAQQRARQRRRRRRRSSLRRAAHVPHVRPPCGAREEHAAECTRYPPGHGAAPRRRWSFLFDAERNRGLCFMDSRVVERGGSTRVVFEISSSAQTLPPGAQGNEHVSGRQMQRAHGNCQHSSSLMWRRKLEQLLLHVARVESFLLRAQSAAR